MIIALTGTPGTGKSSICEHLKERYLIIDLNELVHKEGLHLGRDEIRGALVADIEALQHRITELVMSETATIIIEGHLSHFMDGMDAVIVLRTRPAVLARRLAARGYPKEKIQENMEAEALDVILIEAVEQHHKVYEVQTTSSTPVEASCEIISIIELIEAHTFEKLEEYLPGRFDWSEEVFP